MTTTDQDILSGDTHTYTLVSGTGSEDNSAFTLSSTGALSFSSPPDFDQPIDTNTDNIYSIRVRTTDSGTPQQYFEKVFVISVTDVADTPFGSIVQQAPTQSDPSTTGTVDFVVYFDTPIDVSSLTPSDFVLSGSTSARIAQLTEIAPNNSTAYQLRIS